MDESEQDASRTPTRRFSDRVEYYVRCRPEYPVALADCFRDHLSLGAGTRVADLGSGTGLLTGLLLDLGARVQAVEPNREMRRAAETILGGHSRFESREGTAEATGLPSSSVELVTAAQAFHWFDVEASRTELRRILVEDGFVALIWNRRRDAGSAFLERYESLLLRHGTDYTRVDHRRSAGPETLRRFFGPGSFRSVRFDNAQLLDWEGLKGRLLSSSYAPLEGHPGHRSMMEELRAIFDRTERGGTVRVDYDTELHYGRLDGEARS